MPTEFDATRYAARLGVTREVFPEWFEPDWDEDRQRWLDWRCTLPSPYSDAPRACLWEPFLMRALGWPEPQEHSQHKGQWHCGGYYGPWQSTPTAALAAAFDAKEAK